ncbi:MAG: N-acetylneuraminate synthase [Pseudomonadota bacterium]
MVIAEAGVNHNGRLDLALKLVDAAAAAGADYVKFQTFSPDRLVTRNAAKADYQKARAGGGSQHEMLARLALSEDDHRALLARCRERGIGFLSSPFDLESIEFLQSLGQTLWKIPSGEITHLAFLRKIGSLGGRVILSSGMAELSEIGDALDVLAESGTPREKVTVLQCHTEYPTAFADANLRAMDTIDRAFGVAVGFSDHTPGIEASVAAVARGAGVIEKHLTLDRSLPGPDHAASLEPTEMTALVSAIRNVEMALGDGVKAPTGVEMKNRLAARKSLVASKSISKGEIFSPENVTAKRPGTGVSPMEADQWMGRVASRDYEQDEPL